jgi:small GTP-binding protein
MLRSLMSVSRRTRWCKKITTSRLSTQFPPLPTMKMQHKFYALNSKVDATLSDNLNSDELIPKKESKAPQSPQDIILEQERKLLRMLNDILVAIEAEYKDIELLGRVEKGLEELFLMVVVGEFNSGKSSFINALLGDHFLKEGITPTTSNLHLIRHGPLRTVFDPKTFLTHVTVPLAWLKNITLVDTPGTNAVIREHQEITEHFVPRSDLVIFLTSTERPFTESENEFLSNIKQWGKKVLVVINKYDLLKSDADRTEVERFVRDGIIKMLGFEPQMFMVSAREALQHKLESSSNPFSDKEPTQSTATSQSWVAMEQYIFNTLNSVERIKLKLENPLGVASNLLAKYTKIIDQRLEVLHGDRKTIENIDKSLEQFAIDMKKEFELQQGRLDNIIHELVQRGNRFFDDFIAFENVLDLVKKNVVSEKFEKQVIADLNQRVELHISEVIDWMLDRKYRQWKAVTDYVNKRARVSTNEEKLVGSLKSEFNFNRKELILSIGQSADSVIKSYDTADDALQLNRQISSSLTTTAAVGVGAVGIGTASWFLAPTAMATSMGLLGAVVVGAGSLYVLPYRRTVLRNRFAKNVEEMRQLLRQNMSAKFESELNESVSSIKSAIFPYSQFVNVEFDKFTKHGSAAADMKIMIDRLRGSIEMLDKKNVN